MSKFVKENLLLLITFSSALISVNLIYRFFLSGELGVPTELSIIPLVITLIYWGIKTDSWQKLLSFPCILAALTLSYLEMMVKFQFIAARWFEGDGKIFTFGGTIIWAIIFLIILSIIRLGFLTVIAFFKEIQIISN